MFHSDKELIMASGKKQSSYRAMQAYPASLSVHLKYDKNERLTSFSMASAGYGDHQVERILAIVKCEVAKPRWVEREIQLASTPSPENRIKKVEETFPIRLTFARVLEIVLNVMVWL